MKSNYFNLDLNTVYYFVGIGGFCTSALARLLANKGYKVKGSDVKIGRLAQQCQIEGIVVNEGHHVNNIENSYTVIPSDNLL